MKNQKVLNLGDMIFKWRAMSKLGQRGAAESMGLSASTIHRIETGEMVPDGASLMKIFNWLMKPAENGK